MRHKKCCKWRPNFQASFHNDQKLVASYCPCLKGGHSLNKVNQISSASAFGTWVLNLGGHSLYKGD